MPQILLFNKPYGVLCQFTGQATDKTLASYIPFPDFYAAGRLDKNSEGLLVLTDNGRLQYRLSHPQFNKKKGYWVQVEGIPQAKDFMPFTKPFMMGNELFKPASISLMDEPALWPRVPPIRFRQSIPTTWLNIILQEGKNHQIRRMTALMGFPTLRLVRYQIDEWLLGDLKPGELRACLSKHLC